MLRFVIAVFMAGNMELFLRELTSLKRQKLQIYFRYALMLITVVYMACLVTSIWFIIDILIRGGSGALSTKICKLEKVASSTFTIYNNAVRFFPGLLTPFIYLTTFLLLTIGKSIKLQEKDKKRQVTLFIHFLQLTLNFVKFPD